MKQLRIIHIIPSLIKGGAERLTLDICIELNKRDDCDVKLITLHPENMFVEQCKGLDVEFCNSYVIPSISKKNQINFINSNFLVVLFGNKFKCSVF